MGIVAADAATRGATAPAAGADAQGLLLEFVASDGSVQRGPLASTWQVKFETRAPMRVVRSLKGQRNFSGWWWSATTGGHVGFESWLEREHLMLLDRDPSVVGISSQPFWLHWTGVGGTQRRHAPDYFARRRDGSGLVVDVRPDGRIGPRDAEAFAITATACEQVGWGYRRVGAVDPMMAANVRWLAGYRHPRCYHGERADALRCVFTSGRPFGDGVAEVGDPIGVRPVAFHLLWAGALNVDLGRRLTDASVVTTSGRGVR